MITIILVIVLIVATLLTLKYFSGRSKSHNEKNALESIAGTIGNQIGSGAKSFAKGIRSIEAIKKELLQKINEAQAKSKVDFSIYIEQTITARKTHESLLRGVENQIPTVKSKAKENKAKFEETKDEKYKRFADKYITQMINLENIRTNSTKSLQDCKDAIEEASINYDISLSAIESKRGEILSMTADPRNSFALQSIDISNLTVEFKDRMQQVDTRVESTEIINKDSITNNTNVSVDQINEMYNSL